MPISNYPNGFTQGVAIQGIPILNTYGGNALWVDSGSGSDSGKGTHNQPFATIDYAVGRCTANNGDIIMVKAGHIETVIAAGGLDLDVAGITIIFLGSGSDQAYITFTTDVGADMDVDAANITLINPKFVAGIDALTGPIDVNAADFTIINGEYHDATDIETTDCIIGIADSTRLCIDGWKYFKANENGTQKESHIQLNGVDDCILKNLHIEGDFDTGIIENVTDEVLRITMEDHYLKNTDPGNGPCATLDSACSGWASRLNWRNADGTVVDDVADINWAPDAIGYSTDGYSGNPIGTADASGWEGKIDVIDAYHDVATADAVTNTVMSDVVGNKTDAGVQAVTTTKTLMAYLKGALDILAGTTGISTYPAAAAAANGVSMAEVIRYMSELQVPRIALKESGDMTGMNSGEVLFTVTGDVLMRVGASVDVAVTSTSGTTTMEVGVAGNTASLCIQDAVDNTAFAIGDSWSLVTAADTNGAQIADEWLLVGNGVDVILTISVDDLTAGEMDFYCQYIPLTAASSVVAA